MDFYNLHSHFSQYREGPYYGGVDNQYAPAGGYNKIPERAPPMPERNDCEIIVVSKALT